MNGENKVIHHPDVRITLLALGWIQKKSEPVLVKCEDHVSPIFFVNLTSKNIVIEFFVIYILFSNI